MNNDLKRRLKSGILAIMLAGGINALDSSIAKAEEKTTTNETISYKQGSFVNINETYSEYIVLPNDYLAKISEKICRFYGVPITTKYWPVLAFLNDYPRVIQPGDIIVFPSSIEEMERLLTQLKASGWFSRYVQKNNVYNENKSQTTVRDLITEIYGKECSEDPEFIEKYLKIHGLSKKYNADSIVENTNQMFELTDWIPTLDELNYLPKKVK